MKILKKGKSKFYTLLALIATVLCAVVAAITGLFGGLGAGVETASATATGTSYSLGTSGNFTGSALAGLMGKIMGSTTAKSYNELKAYMDKDTDHARTGTEIDAQVTLGGQTWNVVYASETKGGDVIATLWLAESSDTQQWNNWYNSSSYDWDYPSNMYGTSFVRSYLTGSPYAKSARGGGISTNDVTLALGAQSATWKTFITQYGNYIDTPSQVTYQETETHTITSGYNYLNEAYGKPSSESWPDINHYICHKSGYNDWQYDKLWLPSITETGASNRVGLWNISTTAMSNGTSCWLRSGLSNDSSRAYLILSSSSTNFYTVNNNYVVRPALHLNLKAAASKAGLFVEKPTINPTTAVFSKSAITIPAPFGPSSYNCTVPAGWSLSATTITVPANTPVGTYMIEVTTFTGECWEDGTVGPVYLPFQITPLQITQIAYGGEAGGTDDPVYTGSPISLTATGTTASGSVSLPVVITGDNVNVGMFGYQILCPSNNYAFASNVSTQGTIVVAPQNISAVNWSITNNSGFEYDTQNHAPTASFTASNGQVYSLPVTLTKGGATVTSAVDAGSYTATVAAGTYNTNFKLASASSINFTVNPREVQIDWGTETFAYSGGNRDTAVKLGVASGLLGSDTLALTATYKSGDRVNVSETGFIMEAAISGTSSNYKLPSVKTHTYKITPLTLSGVTATAVGNYTYNGSIQTPEITLSGGNIVSGDTVKTFVSGGGIDAGTHTATVIGINNPNYLLDGTISANFTIKPLDITDIEWSISDGDKFTYNGANHAPEAWFVYKGVTYALTTDLSEAYDASDDEYTANVTAGVFQNNFNLTDIDGAGNAASVSFKINKAQITANDVEWSFTEGFKFAPNTDPAAYALFRYNNVAYILTLNYKDESGNAVETGGNGSQWKTGNYTATVTLGSGADNFVLDENISRAFKITDSAAGSYTVIWEGFSSVVNYNGADQTPSAYIIVDGEKIDVSVSVEKWDGSAWVAANAAKDAGVYRFTATRVNYALANDEVQCRIDPRVISVDYTHLTGLTHGSTENVTATTTDPVASAEMNAGKLNFAVSGSGHVAGTHVVSVEAQVENGQGGWIATGNYSISNATAVQTIGKKVLTINDIEWNYEFVYDGNIKIPSGKVKVSALTTADQAGGAYLIFEFVYAVEAGTYPVKVLGVSNDNYAYAGEINLLIKEFEISEVKWEGVQNGNSVTYNKQDQAPKAYIEVGGSKIYLDGTLEWYDAANGNWTEVAYAINAGEYRVTVDAVQPNTGNYFFASAVNEFTVSKYELSAIYLTQNVFTYDGNTPNIEVYAIGANNERIFIKNYTVLDELGTTVTSYPNAGGYIVQVRAGVLGSNQNYTVTSLVTTTFVINPQLVSVTFEITGNSWSWKVDAEIIPTVTVKANVANAIEVRYGKLGADNNKPNSLNQGLSYSFNISGMTGDGIITVAAISANYQITGASVQTFNIIPVDGEATANFSFDGGVWSDDNLELTFNETEGVDIEVSGDNDVVISYYKDGVLLSSPITTTAGLDAGTYLITVNCPTRELSTNITATTRTFTILPQEVDFAEVGWLIDGSKVAGDTVSYNGQIYNATLDLGDLSDDFEIYYTNGALKNVGSVVTTATVVSKNSNYKAVGVAESYSWTITGAEAAVVWNDDGTVAAISGDCDEATGGSFFVKEGAAYKVVYKKAGVALDGAPTEAGNYTAEVVLALGNDDNVKVTAQSFDFTIAVPEVPTIDGGSGIQSRWWIVLIVITVLAVLIAIFALIKASRKKAVLQDEDGFYDDVTEADLK
ncbi:MAG: hypothetical protein K2O89_05745 [Clostridia bacterium]|nr:hypothetical protein [Clostridia bacterium]